MVLIFLTLGNPKILIFTLEDHGSDLFESQKA